jgi:hypothetical protein
MHKSPLSGSEPEYDPKAWQENAKFNNCMAYAFNDHDKYDRDKKPVPGHQRIHYTCEDLDRALKEDVPEIYQTTFNQACQPGFNKIFLTVSSETQNDFHFYRQDNNGMWSHKPGSSAVTNLDASQQPIINPETADRAYRRRNYDEKCSFYCVPTQFDRDALNRE